VGDGVHLDGLAEGAQVRLALEGAGLKAGSAQRRQEQGDEDGNDSDDDEELDEGERRRVAPKIRF
jgi:hypothetical protein